MNANGPVLTYPSLEEFEAVTPDPAAALFAGEIFVVRKAFAMLGLLDRYKAFYLAAIEKVSGVRARACIEREGLEALHRHVGNEQLVAVTVAVQESIDGTLHEDLLSLVQRLFSTGRFFYCKSPIVRIHVPYHRVARQPQYARAFRSYGGGGKLGAHAPHTDSSVKCPANSINIWISIGATSRGNGISIWPRYHGTQVKSSRERNDYVNYRLGRPVNFDLDAGDILLFHGDHIHGSELNSTDMTRVSVSYRITLDEPVFTCPSGQQYINSETLRAADNTGIQDDLRPEPPKVGGVPDPAAGREHQPGSEIVPAGPDRALVKLPGGKSVYVQRYCTHEGADLCGGYVEDGRIYCPRHNLPFDLRTGRSPCSVLKGLKLHM